jgi:hypothetical protein
MSKSFDPTRWLMAPKVVHTTVGHLFGHLIHDGMLSYDYEYMRNRLEVAIIERPTDKAFFTSFADQMLALPRPDDEHYASVYDMLLSHLRDVGISIPAIPTTSSFPLLFRPQWLRTLTLDETTPRRGFITDTW